MPSFKRVNVLLLLLLCIGVGMWRETSLLAGLPLLSTTEPILSQNRSFSDSIITAETILWSRNWQHLVECPSVPASYYESKTAKVHTAEQLEAYFSNCSGFLWLRTNSRRQPRMSDVSRFATNVVHKMKQNFTIITSDGDRDMPSSLAEFQAILDHPLCQGWYTQNYDGTIHHPKLHPIPIGFDLHTQRDGYWSTELDVNLKHMLEIRRQGLTTDRLLEPLIPPWNPETHSVRQTIEKALSCIPVARLPRMAIDALWRNYTLYKFGLAPRGNGLDTHRLWEMLFFGMVPITQTSSLDPLYEGLPVINVSNYSDLCQSGFLEQEWNKVKDFWPVADHVFTMKWWLQRNVSSDSSITKET